MVDYIGTSDIKLELDKDGDLLPSTDISYDTFLALLATQASRAIDKYTGREDGAYAVTTDTVRYFDGNGKLNLLVDEICSTDITVEVAESGQIDHSFGTTDGNYTTWSSTEFTEFPYNAIAKGQPITELHIDPVNGSKPGWYRYPKAVRLTAYYGYSTSDNTPELIKKACLIQAVRWFKRSDQAFQDTGAIIELGQLVYTQELDPDIRAILGTDLNRVAI